MKVTCVAIAAFLSLASAAQAQELPPQKGYHWERIPEVKAAFLVPDGWFFKREKKSETFGYFISREEIKDSGEFEVGLTINVMQHLRSIKAPDYAKAFLDKFSVGKTELKRWNANQGPFTAYGSLVRDGTTQMHTLMIANPKTNTLYFVMFEAPEREWDKAWSIGEHIVKLLYLDDDI
jgi:hypothetical protein